MTRRHSQTAPASTSRNSSHPLPRSLRGHGCHQCHQAPRGHLPTSATEPAKKTQVSPVPLEHPHSHTSASQTRSHLLTQGLWGHKCQQGQQTLHRQQPPTATKPAETQVSPVPPTASQPSAVSETAGDTSPTAPGPHAATPVAPDPTKPRWWHWDLCMATQAAAGAAATCRHFGDTRATHTAGTPVSPTALRTPQRPPASPAHLRAHCGAGSTASGSVTLARSGTWLWLSGRVANRTS